MEIVDPKSNGEIVNEVDEGLYSRQLYVLGHEAMHRMSESNVLIVGLKGVGCEIGVKSVTLCDTNLVTYFDLASNFYLSEKDVGKPRASACVTQLSELNAHVSVNVFDGEMSDEFLSQFSVLVLTSSVVNQEKMLQISSFCHQQNIRFIMADTFGACARIFCDFGKNFLISDTTGETPKMLIVSAITNEERAAITVVDDERHGLETGDHIRLTDVHGMEDINDKEYEIEVTGPYSFNINTSSIGMENYVRGGYVHEIKPQKVVCFKPLSEAFVTPDEFLLTDFGKIGRSELLHYAFQAMSQYSDDNGGKLPSPGSKEDAARFLVCVERLIGDKLSVSDADRNILLKFALTAMGDISPMAAAVGGIVGQEVLKACSGKFTPIHQWMYFDALEILPEDLSPAELSPTQSRYDGQIALIGRSLNEKLMNQNYFLVGAGAIGCEMLKNWAMMGIGCGKNGHIHITDMDCIEKSNLSRQFLFRNTDISKLKSKTAASAAMKMNPDVNITAYADAVGESTENIFHDKFMFDLDGICTALDNVAARLYMDQRAVQFQKPLFESGTLGTKGNTQVVVPFLTENYGASRDPPEKSVPICTLKNFPHQIEHTLQWARDTFEGSFKQTPEDANNYLSSPDFITSLESQQNTRSETLKRIQSSLVTKKPLSFDDCISWARHCFQEWYYNSISQLLYSFPPDQLTSSGTPFWSGHKRPPTPLEFNPSDDLHLDFIIAASHLRAHIYGLKGESDADYYRKILSTIKVEPFQPRVMQIATKDSELAETENKTEVDSESFEYLVSQLPSSSSMAGYKLFPLDFEKDDDSNYHMDFITAASNLRARNYKIPEADRHQSKRIAGKIIPAIATTTALVGGLIALEVYKVLQKKPLESYRNGFCNLALPLLTLCEPVECAKTKSIGEEWSVWNRIDLEDKDMTLKGFIDYFEEKFELDISMISYGNTILHAFFNPASKTKPRMVMTLPQLVESVSKTPIDKNLIYLVFEVCASDADDEDVELPQIRYKLPR